MKLDFVSNMYVTPVSSCSILRKVYDDKTIKTENTCYVLFFSPKLIFQNGMDITPSQAFLHKTIIC